MTSVDSVQEVLVVKDEENRDGSKRDDLGEVMDASVNEEAGGAHSDGGAYSESQQENLILEGICELGLRPLLASETSTDQTIAHIRSLAEREKEGYDKKKMM